jgi:trypsin-like peptidase/tetratricopeptide repeat protein
MHVHGESDMDPSPGRRVAIARVEGGGTAFAISSHLALTAFHVVRDAGAGKVRLSFAEDTGSLTASVERSDATLDMAVLRLEEPGLPGDLTPLAMSISVRHLQAWRAYGYPAATGDSYTIAGSVMDPDALLPGKIPAIQLHCLQEAARSPLPLGGMSGSPVLDQESGSVIGIIRLGLVSAEVQPGTVGGDIFATSLAHATGLWPDLLAPLVRQQRRRQRADLSELLVNGLSPAGELPKVAEMEAHQVGARRTRYSEAHKAPYVRRPDVDAKLAELLRGEHVIIVVGPSSAGKTRTAFQALSVNLPQAGFAYPLPSGQAIRKLIQADREEPLCAGPLVVWLDDLDEYLRDDSGISPAIIEWLEQRADGGVIVATIREDQYNDRRGSAGNVSKAAQLFLDRAERGFFQLRHTIARNEAEQAARLYPGEDFGDPELGIGLRLVAGPELVRRLRDAETGNPAGWALIKAAMDYLWMGLPAPVPEAALRRLFGVAMRDRFPQLAATDEAYRQGLSWACHSAGSGVALLSRSRAVGLRHAVAFELLDHAAEYGLRQDWAVPGNAWHVAISVASTADLLSVSAAAEARDLPDVAISALERAAGNGNSAAAIELGLALAGSGDFEVGKQWITRAVEAHEVEALSAMGALLAQADDLDAARDWLWRGIEAGDLSAASLMGKVQRACGQRDEAMYWLQIDAEEGDGMAWLLLADLHGESDGEAAAHCLERGASGDGAAGAWCQWRLARDRGDYEGAEWWLRSAAELGEVDAGRMLGELLGDRGNVSESEHWLRRVMNRDPNALHDLGVLFENAGDPAAAHEWYLRAYDRGVGLSAVSLARLQLAAGDVTQAAQWLRVGADSADTEPEDVCPVAVELAERLRREGAESDAVTWLEESAAAGWVPAMPPLASRAAADGDWGTAERWYLKAASAGYPGAAAGLGQMLESRGELHRAKLWLMVAAQPGRTPDDQAAAVAAALGRVTDRLGPEKTEPTDTAPGGTAAAEQLAAGSAAEEHGDSFAARMHYMQAAVAGNAEGAYRYATLLRADGGDSGAEPWLRRAAEGGHIQAAADLAQLTSDPLELTYWTAVACRAGHAGMLRNVAAVKFNAGHKDEAEQLYRRAAETGDLAAAGTLGALLHERGEIGQARDWLTCAADGGSEEAAHNLGVLALGLGDRGEAIAWFRRAADAGFVPAMHPLAIIFEEDGDAGQSEAWLTREFEHGSGQAAAEMALRRHQQGDREGALTWARDAAKLDHPGAALMAGLMTYHDGELAEAEKWLRVAASANIQGAAVRLAALVARRGDRREAETLLARPVQDNDPFALQGIADLAVRRGWISAAESFYRAAAQRGHLFAALDAAALADMRGARMEKAKLLRSWQSTESMSARSLHSYKDVSEVGLTIYHPAEWEPGQARAYGLSTPAFEFIINAPGCLDQDEFGR